MDYYCDGTRCFLLTFSLQWLPLCKCVRNRRKVNSFMHGPIFWQLAILISNGFTMTVMVNISDTICQMDRASLSQSTNESPHRTITKDKDRTEVFTYVWWFKLFFVIRWALLLPVLEYMTFSVTVVCKTTTRYSLTSTHSSSLFKKTRKQTR